MATRNGNSYKSDNGTYYAKIVYTITETNTTYRIKSDYYLHAVTALSENMLWDMKYKLGGNTHSGSFSTPVPTLSAGSEYHAFARDVTITKTTSAKSFNVTFTCNDELMTGGSKAELTLTIPALASYDVKYNGNNATSGVPATQKKYYSKALTLSSTKPTRVGHTFNNWKATNGTLYNAGGSYTTNAPTTMTAQWTSVKYTIKYEANGGTGSIPNQTKAYDEAISLSNGVGFTKENYNIIGWATSANSSTVNYALGYKLPANRAPGFTTLYAVWEQIFNHPIISDLKAERYTVNTTEPEQTGPDDVGESIYVEFNWKGGSLDGGVTYRTSRLDISINGVSVYNNSVSEEGSFNQVFSTTGGYSINSPYVVTVTLQDEDSAYSRFITETSITVPTAIFPIDILEDGSAMGLMMTAQNGKILSMPNIFIDLSNYSSTGTDDEAIYNLLDQFNWLDVNE